MVKVEKGSFEMSKADGENWNGEKPHQVELKHDFYIGQTEITQGQWKAVMGDNPSVFKNGANYPVENVSWYDAMKFCDRLNETDKAPKGWRYTLPTETQWEYAARGGNRSRSYKYSGSDTIDDVGWYETNAGKSTHPVAQKQANELGLYDMCGNVWEWCLDDYIRYSSGANPEFSRRSDDRSGSRRVHRGGGWNVSARHCRSALRGNIAPSSRDGGLGFRLVLVPIPSNLPSHDNSVMAANGSSAFPATIQLPNGTKIEMVKIKAGSFMMGSPENELGRVHDEKRHRVTLTRDFWLGTFEVTQGQWKSVMGNNPSFLKSGNNYPVENVSWHDAKKFCDTLNERYSDKLPQGYHFDLPTEAQWEYACRAGTITALNSGKNLTGNDYYCENLNELGWYKYKRKRLSTHEVGQKRPNAWGMYDMHGNVWEWCRDWYGDYDGDATDPTGPASGTKRIFRGGSWHDASGSCRSANRGNLAPTFRSNNLGFRLALVPIESDQMLNLQRTSDYPYHFNSLTFYAPMEQETSRLSTGQAITTHGNVTYTEVDGIRCAHFDGKSYLTFPTDTFPRNDCSISLWVKCPQLSKLETNIFSSGKDILLERFSGKLIVRSNAGKPGHDKKCKNSFNYHTWNHIVYTFSTGSPNRIQVFMNGKPYASFAHVTNGPIYPIGYIGTCRFYPQHNILHGYMAAVRVYNRRLSQQEISQLATELTPGKSNNISPRGSNEVFTKIITLPGRTKLEMVKVEAGTFEMSARDGENERNEVPHFVTLKKDFYIGKTEVTQAQWAAVMKGRHASQDGKSLTNPSKWVGDNLPVHNISWYDAMDFCQIINDLELAPKGWKFSLPTETQWEYAAKGGIKSRGYKYSGSNDLDLVAWSIGNSGEETHPVATGIFANELGLFDMSGNVWEWCLDDYANDSRNVLPEFTRSVFGSSRRRVFRGGGWNFNAKGCRSSYRAHYNPGHRDAGLGFRLALVPVQ